MHKPHASLSRKHKQILIWDNSISLDENIILTKFLIGIPSRFLKVYLLYFLFASITGLLSATCLLRVPFAFCMESFSYCLPFVSPYCLLQVFLAFYTKNILLSQLTFCKFFCFPLHEIIVSSLTFCKSSLPFA